MEWAIEALDTLFFRGPDPFIAGESVFLRSLFPPTPRTIQGMVRTTLLEEHCTDLSLFAAGKCDRCPVEETCAVRDVVGSPQGIGTLRLRGPYVLCKVRGGFTRLYPTPGDLRVDECDKPFRLALGDPTPCDMGNVRLPRGRDGTAYFGEDDVDRGWITEEGLRSYLDGDLPMAEQLVGRSKLLDGEPRVGLARDAKTRTALKSMLYSIEPLRPRSGVGLGVRVDGAPDSLLRAGLGLRRLGGEGRLVDVTERVASAMAPLGAPARAEIARTGRLLLLLLQPADFDGNWLPHGFSRYDENGVTIWRGQVKGIALKIIVSCGGSPVAIGGWSLADGHSTALRRYVPAGTVYYCELEGPFDVDSVLNMLDDAKVGGDTEIGFGHMAVGAWVEG